MLKIQNGLNQNSYGKQCQPSSQQSNAANSAVWDCTKKCSCSQLPRFFKENKEAFATLTEIEEAYGVICEEYEEKPYSHTQLWKYLQRFASLGIVKNWSRRCRCTGTFNNGFFARCSSYRVGAWVKRIVGYGAQVRVMEFEEVFSSKPRMKNFKTAW